MRTLVTTDVHGAAKALDRVLDKANYDPASDKVVFLGDIVDGFPEVGDAITRLMSMPSRVLIRGNHDEWARKWMADEHSTETHEAWIKQGGKGTVVEFGGGEHTALLGAYLAETEPFYYDEEKDHLFVHGGLPPKLWQSSIAEVEGFEDKEEFWWDRTLVGSALFALENSLDHNLTSFTKVFVGHTPLRRPMEHAGVIALDTGAGFGGQLTMVDADTGDYWMSQHTSTLYGTPSPRIANTLG